ncbi:MAG: hypothetical protein LBS03_04445 [Bacteroidales bacterium]|jgi:hypothetical protein|nr:hypothetical protein [Bacteroidales bacterium]
MKKVFVMIAVATLLMPATSKAQTEFSVGADLVSSYVWRGSVGAGASFQPSVGLTAGGFSIGFWGSTDIASLGLKEVDLSLGYSVGGLSIGLTDYWWNGEGSFEEIDTDGDGTPDAVESTGFDYFQLFKEDANSHLLELNLGYSFEFGLSLSLNTMLAGAQDKYVDDNGELKRSFTTYFELGYDFSIGDVSLTAALGLSPWNKTGLYTGGYPYATDGLAVTNIALTASKEIAITDKFSLPVFGQIGFNPAKEDVFLVFGISF